MYFCDLCFFSGAKLRVSSLPQLFFGCFLPKLLRQRGVVETNRGRGADFCP